MTKGQSSKSFPVSTVSILESNHQELGPTCNIIGSLYIFDDYGSRVRVSKTKLNRPLTPNPENFRRVHQGHTSVPILGTTIKSYCHFTELLTHPTIRCLRRSRVHRITVLCHVTHLCLNSLCSNYTQLFSEPSSVSLPFISDKSVTLCPDRPKGSG